MVSAREYRIERPTISKKSSSGNSVSLSSLSKKPSNSSLASPGTPGFDLAYNNMISPPPSTFSTKSQSFSPQTKDKIKPLLLKISSQETQSVDLSRSAAENEGLGIFTNSGYTGTAGGRKGLHTRTSSAVSQVSTTTSSSGHRTGTQYVHPMRQIPQSYTPTLVRSRSRANSDDEHFIADYSLPTLYASSYAPLPPSKRTPPPLHIRTHSNNSNPRVNSSSQGNLNNIPGTPSSLRQASEPFSPESMPLTARSSLESAFRKRSRNNTINDDPYAYVQQLRAEFAAKEAAKDQKYAEARARAADKEARRQERRAESQRRREENAERKRARSRANSEKDDQLSAIGYDRTAPGLPVDEELEYIRRGIPPPTRVKRTGTQSSSVGKKAKAAASTWSLFVFNLKTMWLKFKRAMGAKSRS